MVQYGNVSKDINDKKVLHTCDNDTLPSLPSQSSEHTQWANTELASLLFAAIYTTAA